MAEESVPVVDTSKLPEDKGADTLGAKYSSIQDLWAHELGKPEEEKESSWYTKAIDYWAGVPATIDGMMGGLTEISRKDLRTSHDFLQYFLTGKCPGRKPTNSGRALVDLVEQNNAFVEEAKKTITTSKMGNFYCSGLQDFNFEVQYDIIWIQWVIGHLHDQDLLKFLLKCKNALAPNGLLCIKDNTCENGFVMDKDDSSVTRSDEHFRAIFEQAGMTVVRALLQPNFPKKLFPVRIYALE